VLKGIQTVDDAYAAMDAHVDRIVVSNHGACPWSHGPERAASEYARGCPLARNRRRDPTARLTWPIVPLFGIGEYHRVREGAPRPGTEQGKFTVLFDSGTKYLDGQRRHQSYHDVGSGSSLSVRKMFMFRLKISGLLRRTMRLFLVVVGRPTTYGTCVGR
jgi:hypothetical protein